MQTEGQMERRTDRHDEFNSRFRSLTKARTEVSTPCYTTAVGKEDNSSVSICLPLQF
jgi:hypothetical protein